MNEFPEVTVLLPVFNGERFLLEQIESIVRQECVIVSLLVVDDGSTDDSWSILLLAKKMFQGVLLTRHASNIGLIQTIGELLGRVETPYFALADQDDIWDTDKLRRSIHALDQGGSSLVYSDVRVCDEHGQTLQSSYWRSRGIRPISGDDPVPFVFQNPAIGHTIVARQKVANLARRMPQRIVHHEVWIIAAAMATGDVRYVDAVLGSYRLHGDNVVGPKQRGLFARAMGLVRTPGRLELRSRARTEGMVAVAGLHPGLAGAAKLMEASGLAGVRGLPAFTRFLAPYRLSIGRLAVSIELLLFVLVRLRRPNAARHISEPSC